MDPLATGVIPISLGQATRMMEYLISGTKEYRAEIVLGVETNTYDALGKVVSTSRVPPQTSETLTQTVNCFVGNINQVPPMYSALKHKGKRLYELARSGIEVGRDPRKVKVFSISVLRWNPPHLALKVICGRGFYMRSLAHDLGELLKCGGHLSKLVRTRSGSFDIKSAISLPEAEERFATDSWPEILRPVDSAVPDMQAATVDQHTENMLLNGQTISEGITIPDPHPGTQCRVYSLDGTFLAILSFNMTSHSWKPHRVFSLR